MSWLRFSDCLELVTLDHRWKTRLFSFCLVDLLPDEHQKQPKSIKPAYLNRTDGLCGQDNGC